MPALTATLVLRPWRLTLALRIWATFLGLLVSLRTRRLPDVVERLSSARPHTTRMLHPHQLSRASFRVLRLGPYQPRCLYRALVLYRMLRLQGQEAVLVIGLPEGAVSKDAHAWVELDGRDVGPPPGRAGHVPLVRYPDPSLRQSP